jgi:CrcB protein
VTSPLGREPFRDPDIDPETEAQRAAPWPRLPISHVAVVFGGGIVGGLARYGISRGWPTPGSGFPASILVINTAGSFVLAVLVTVLAMRAAPAYLRPLLGTGFCGAFTTFSSVVTASDLLLAHGHIGIAIGYLAASVAAGLVAAYLGMALAGRVLGESS